jgi:hypothetical protein
MTAQQNCAGNKQGSHKIKEIQMFETSKCEPKAQNIIGLKLAAAKHTTVQVTRLPLLR